MANLERILTRRQLISEYARKTFNSLQSEQTEEIVERPPIEVEINGVRYRGEFSGNDWTGKCTYYSHAGCVGCSRGQIMANGQPFREWASTIAFMELDLNEWVTVANMNNGLWTVAQVTDRGNFWRYGYMADLSLGVSRTIGHVTAVSDIAISHIVLSKLEPEEEPITKVFGTSR